MARRRGRLGREPLAGQELRRGVVIGVDVHDLDAELRVLQPLPTHGAFLRAVGARGALRIGRPEHDHVAVLQAVLDGAVGFRLADAQRVAPVVHGAPVPAFPAIGIVVHARHADRIGEAVERRQVVADVAPGVMRAVRGGDRAGPVIALQRLISLATRSSASSQEMRTYSDLPRFCGLRLPFGSKSTRFIGCSSRSGE